MFLNPSERSLSAVYRHGEGGLELPVGEQKQVGTTLRGREEKLEVLS